MESNPDSLEVLRTLPLIPLARPGRLSRPPWCRSRRGGPRPSWPWKVGRDRPLIVLAAQMDPTLDNPTPKDIYCLGVTAKVIRTAPVDDKTVKVIVEGKKRARILEVVGTHPVLPGAGQRGPGLRRRRQGGGRGAAPGAAAVRGIPQVQPERQRPGHHPGPARAYAGPDRRHHLLPPLPAPGREAEPARDDQQPGAAAPPALPAGVGDLPAAGLHPARTAGPAWPASASPPSPRVVPPPRRGPRRTSRRASWRSCARRWPPPRCRRTRPKSRARSWSGWRACRPCRPKPPSAATTWTG